MSIFSSVTTTCPACNTAVEFELVQSVNVDRRPDLREAIVDGSFQREPCPSCGTKIRIEPEFVYMDAARGQYIGVWPSSKRGEWQERAADTRRVFDQALGKNAPPEAKRMGAQLDVRAVFGWHALVEKLLARQAGIDDRTLELAKLAVMRSQSETPVPGRRELRLVGIKDDGDLLLGWAGGGDMSSVLKVPRQLIADIDADPAAWAVAREGVAEGDVVDFQREMLAA